MRYKTFRGGYLLNIITVNSSLVVLILLFSLYSPLVHANEFSNSETILFCTTGYTNNSGDLGTQKQRATLAAKFLAEKQLTLLVNKLSTNQTSQPLINDWKQNIDYFDIRVIPPNDPRSSNLFGVVMCGKVSITRPSNTEFVTHLNATPLLNIKFSSTKMTYYEGEEIIFKFSGNKDFYACILDLNDKGEIIQLLPNAYRLNNFFSGDTDHFFPELTEGDDFRLEVSPPYGTEKVHFFASSSPFESILPVNLENFTIVNSQISDALAPLHQTILNKMFSSTTANLYQYTKISTNIITIVTQESKSMD